MRPDFVDRSSALFLDFDGTLVDLDEDRDRPRLTPTQAEILRALADALGGAVALVSGRILDDLDRRSTPALWRIGSHGAEKAAPFETAALPAFDGDPRLIEAARRTAESHDGVELELKPHGVALHFRKAPQHEQVCRAALGAAVALTRNYDLQFGKMVVEARLAGVTKGMGVSAIARTPVFEGRRFFAFGDDATDESMFSVVKQQGGVAVKIGQGETIAAYRMASPEDVWKWLRDSLATIGAD